MYNRLASGKINLHLEHMCPNCINNEQRDTALPYLTCSMMLETKTKRIATVMTLLQKCSPIEK